MSEKIIKIGLAELNTVRIKIGDVISEMPLDGHVIDDFTNHQMAARKMNQADKDRLVSLICEMAAAKDILQTIGVEFVLPGE